MSRADVNSDSDGETYTIPLQDQRVFGAGIKRKRIAFVPARTDADISRTETDAKARGRSAALRYREIVSGTSSTAASNATNTSVESSGTVIPAASGEIRQQLDTKQNTKQSRHQTQDQEADQHENSDTIPGIESKLSTTPSEEAQEEAQLCPTCHLPLDLTSQHHNHDKVEDSAAQSHHEALLAHQLSLPHTYAPSHLDRQRMGLRYLASYGWDPDSREGLGRDGAGRLVPVKAVPKNDTVGLGVEKGETRTKAVKKQKLNAKEVRTLVARERREREMLGDRVFGRGDEIERLLHGR